ncbi:MAG TPA: nuclear transport factor 2 family protein [Novosphingobium sp.]|nr:nuclear transport factor 2 family protein [Novosphingobium sp.]HQA17323.1 nuclear transport factor 2 family protein [Novosphingobium sp.]
MSFSTMRHWLAGGAIAVAIVGSAQAQQDPNAMFEARYTELRTAMLGGDKATVEKILAPEYEATDIRGETHQRAMVLERLGQLPEGMEQPQGKVLTVKVNGDSAAVESQMTMHMKRTGDDGAEMALEIVIVSDDQWVQRGGAWLLKSSVQKDISVSKDGEVVFHQAN